MVACSATLNTLAADYAALGTWIGLATGAPGATASPSSEASGGSPAYARKQTTWSSGTTGVQNGSAVTIDVAAATYTYVLIASSSSGNNQMDNASITSVVMGGQGQIVVTPAFTQT